ncbi:hypothetical protein Neosp_000372 [[Neocosmospora] mangrovei]
MDPNDRSWHFRCVWSCVRKTIINLNIDLPMWGENFREFLNAFYDPDNADTSYPVDSATIGCMLFICNMTLIHRLSESLQYHGAATGLPAPPVDFCCDLQGVCMSCDWL